MKKLMTPMVFILVLSVLLALTGCGLKPADDEVTIGHFLIFYNYNGYEAWVNGMQTTHQGVEVGMEIMNHTNLDAMVKSAGLSVNGYMLPTSGLEEVVVAPGETRQCVLVLTKEDLAEAHIDTVAEISLHLNFHDIYTGGLRYKSKQMNLRTSAADDYTQPVYDGGSVVLSENGLRVVCKELRSNGDLMFHFQNDLSKNMTFCVENITVNGVAVDESLVAVTRSLTKCIDGISLGEISCPATVEFTVRVEDDYGLKTAKSEMISLNFD